MTKSDVKQLDLDQVEKLISPETPITLSCLPDDIVLNILNKVMDLKTLCLCKVVSKSFYSIVHQVNTIRTFHDSLVCSIDDHRENEWLKPISMFKRLKSVCIQISHDNNKPCNGYLCKWKVKMGSNRIDYLVSPTSIYDNKGLLLYEEKHNEKFPDKRIIVIVFLLDALLIVIILWRIMNQDFPFLERVTINDSDNKVAINDSDNKGRVSVNGRETIDELRKWKTISSFVPRASQCYLPSLELPVSGYVMEGVTLVLVENRELTDDGNYDRFIDDHDQIDGDKHDKQEAAYHEAMMEIFKRHKGSISRDEYWAPTISATFMFVLLKELKKLSS